MIMADSIITLTTDFGEDSPYVAAMKGVILGINPAPRLIDLSHQIPPQNVRHAAAFLRAALPYFPPECIHVIVVDPGVGTERAILYVETNGIRLLAPDNGCWTWLPGSDPRVIRVEERRYGRTAVSATFHGRDIFAPVAARLSLGLDPQLLGPLAATWQRCDRPAAERIPGGVTGEVVWVDHFGNLLTNIPASMIQGRPVSLRVDGRLCEEFAWVRTYGAAALGQLVLLVSSEGVLEIAVTQGSAARQLDAGPGVTVTVGFADGGHTLPA
jgi:S-adenosylmethionine hydrolase